MLSVQLELKELQEKYCLCYLSLLISRRVAKAEMLLQDDGEVSKLEEECNWFRNETNRLQTHSTSMQHDIHVRLSFSFSLQTPLLTLFLCLVCLSLSVSLSAPLWTGFKNSPYSSEGSKSIFELSTQSCHETKPSLGGDTSHGPRSLLTLSLPLPLSAPLSPRLRSKWQIKILNWINFKSKGQRVLVLQQPHPLAREAINSPSVILLMKRRSHQSRASSSQDEDWLRAWVLLL
jgi:hypothetical protein